MAFLLTTFDPRDFDLDTSLFWLLIAWVGPLIFSGILIVGIPFYFLLFWVLYRLLYTEDSRLKLFFIAVATHSAMGILVNLFADSAGLIFRSLIAVAVLTVAFFKLKKAGVFQQDLI